MKKASNGELSVYFGDNATEGRKAVVLRNLGQYYVEFYMADRFVQKMLFSSQQAAECVAEDFVQNFGGANGAQLLNE